jgi:hypothetical protein
MPTKIMHYKQKAIIYKEFYLFKLMDGEENKKHWKLK